MIDIDKDGDSGDVVFIDETFDANKKGKAIKDVFDGLDDNQAKVCEKHFKYVLAVDL